MMNSKPGLLLFSPLMVRMCAPIAERFEVLRLWEEPDGDNALKTRGQNIVAILTYGKDRIDDALLDKLPNLKVITAVGAGYEEVDVHAARRRGIMVANAGDTHSGDCADHAVALALALINKIIPNDDYVRNGSWATKGYPPLRRALSAERFGIIGLGRIGHAIADRLVPFGVEIAWWGPNPKPAPWPRYDSPAALAAWCTTMIVAARGDALNLIDSTVLDALGPDGHVVNVSRGGVIDEDAMILALQEGRLGGAGLDVFAEEPTTPARWAGVPNVILSAHVAGQTIEAMARLRDAAVSNLKTALDGGPVINEVMK